MRSCGACGSPTAAEARFCPACGAPQGRPCPSCGAIASPGARFCPSCGAALETPALQDERKLVTVLFADVTGSTELGERLDPERMGAILSSYFSTMAAVIEGRGGTVEKFIGDAIVAVFGAPVIREDDAPRALHAALEMLERLRALNSELQRRHGVALEIRIGVNTGEVVAPGSGLLRQMIVLGDPANVAARLQQVAEPGTTLVGERTWRAARDEFEFGEPQSLDLKGKAGRVTVRRLIGPSIASGSHGFAPRSPLVGRTSEIEALVALLEQVWSGPRLVVVEGPAGIGKSRLVSEFERMVGTSAAPPRVLHGRCPPAGHGSTLWALGVPLRQTHGIVLDEQPESAATKLASGVRTALAAANLLPDEVERTVYALGRSAGVELPASPFSASSAEEMAHEIERAWGRYLSALATGRPALVVIEDLHWADDDLLGLLARGVARTTGSLLLLATARPDFWAAHPGFRVGPQSPERIPLHPLTAAESAELIAGAGAQAAVAPALADEIFAKTEGNPLFIEEVMRRLMDEGALDSSSDGTSAGAGPLVVPLPESIHALLAARIDALEPVEKRLLQDAAVMGRDFWEAALARTSSPAEVSPTLRSLERKGLVTEQRSSSLSGQSEYSFVHALVRDVAYESLPKARRGRAHADCARWLEGLGGGRSDELGELIAHHYFCALGVADADLAWGDDPGTRARVRDQAFGALVAAGRAARRRYAVARALELHRQALALAEDGPAQRAMALEEIGDDHSELFHGDEALAAYRDAMGCYSASEDADAGSVRVPLKIASNAVRPGAFREMPDPAAIDELIEKALAAAGDGATRARLLAVRGACTWLWEQSGEIDPLSEDERIASLREACAMAETLHDWELLDYTRNWLLRVSWSRWRVEEGLGTVRRHLEVVDRIASRGARADFLSAAADAVTYLGGDPHAGMGLALRAFELGHDTSPHQLMHTTRPVIEAAFYSGRWAESERPLQAHLEALAREPGIGCPYVRGGPLFGAMMLAHQGRTEEALETAESTLHPPRPVVVAPLYAWCLCVVGRIEEARLIARGWSYREGHRLRPDAQVAMLETLVTLEEWDRLRSLLAGAQDPVPSGTLLGPFTERAKGLARAAGGDRAGAIELLRRAEKGFTKSGALFETARTKEELARLAPSAEAMALLEQARRDYERVEAPLRARS